ncbi:serine--tRNA ligase [Candidatus Nomurabacteria bacterium]|jgi:seryl-tRNA synthetase|nr:MAG: serine--tRNA ligase [Candidatus Nomurabacteria bacterium]
MLDIKFIKENKDIVTAAIKNKNIKAPIDLDRLFVLYDERQAKRTQLDELNQKRNLAAGERNIEEGKRLKEESTEIETAFEAINKEFMAMMLLIPNIPSPDTPVGPDESGNVVIRKWGEPKVFDFTPKEHFELGKALDVIDNETAGEVAGARFTYLKGDLALMQFALIQYAFSVLTNKTILEQIARTANIDIAITAFMPIIPPVFIKPAVFNRMARLEPRDERYYIPSDDLFLIGSAEHTIGPIHMDQIIEEKDLPKRYVGYSTAFRREAGTYGKDTKGILRMHQFDKIEMETFCLPERSMVEQDFIVAIQEYLMQQLQLPYQVILICTGDMGAPDYRQLDIETWLPGQNKYRETQTADLMGSYQARRLNTRVRRIDGKVEPVHMNDATAFAIGRTLIAIMENYQQADGSIKVPDVLKLYLGKDSITH